MPFSQVAVVVCIPAKSLGAPVAPRMRQASLLLGLGVEPITMVLICFPPMAKTLAPFHIF